jgi:hypothetical protein
VSEPAPTADPAGGAPAPAGPSPLLEKFERLMRIGSAITGGLFFLCFLIPTDHSYNGEFRWIWDMALRSADRSLETPGELIELVVMIFPFMAIPIMAIAAGSKRSPMRLFPIAIAALLQFGPLALMVALATTDNRIGLHPDEAIPVAVMLGGAFSFLAAPAGCTGLAMGTQRTAWRVAAGLGGALLALGSFLVFVLIIEKVADPEVEAFKWPLFLSSIAGLLSGVAGLCAAGSHEHRASFAKACLVGIGAGALLLGIFSMSFSLPGWDPRPEELWVILHFDIRALAGGLLGWLFVTAMLQSFSPIEERATA